MALVKYEVLLNIFQSVSLATVPLRFSLQRLDATFFKKKRKLSRADDEETCLGLVLTITCYVDFGSVFPLHPLAVRFTASAVPVKLHPLQSKPPTKSMTVPMVPSMDIRLDILCV